jgi:hypothetical protein
MIHPACIAKIGNLDTDNVKSMRILSLAFLACRSGRWAGLVKGNARHFTRQDIPIFTVRQRKMKVVRECGETYALFSLCFWDSSPDFGDWFFDDLLSPVRSNGSEKSGLG